MINAAKTIVTGTVCVSLAEGISLTNKAAPAHEVKDLPTTGALASFRPHFTQYAEVFGSTIVASKEWSKEKVQHVVGVLAQYIDNDGDGVPDNKAACFMAKQKGVLYLPGTSKGSEAFMSDEAANKKIEAAGYVTYQDLYEMETHPKYSAKKGEPFDAALEEVLHYITNGYAATMPEAFAVSGKGSKLTAAMDKARGGSFKGAPPKKYP